MAGQTQEELLRFDGVTIRFDDQVAVNNVSFSVTPGQTRVLLGAAGAGKTTLLKAAIGLLPVNEGTVSLFGQDITGLSEKELFELRRRVGVLFQEGGLFDSLTVEQNVAYPLVNRKKKIGAELVHQKVKDALSFVELTHTLEKFPNELSGGMRRRVGIARAVVTEPPLVLYDSPTAGLDPITANTIMTLVAKERDTQQTANLIVTHRYQDGEIMANFSYNSKREGLEPSNLAAGGSVNGAKSQTIFMVMNAGRLCFEGSQAELEASKDEYVSKFVLRRR